MKRILLLVVLILVSVTNIQAQKRKKDTTQNLSFGPSLKEALANYDFEKAGQLLNDEIAVLKKDKQPTQQLEEQLQAVQKAQLKMNAVEQVTFVDSIVVPRTEAIYHIPLSTECGALYSAADFLHTQEATERTVFQSQMGDKVFYAVPDAKGVLRLHSSDVYADGSTSSPTPLKGLSANHNKMQNYPFVMADGTTIYFAAQGTESLGGYDIFMSRYDADEHRFLAPENIGMPFNSPANDYLYVVDEFNNLGWFVTDRNMPKDKVCVYTFIPNKTRKVYDPERTTAARLRNLARINSIRETWQHEQEVKSALFRLHEAGETKQTYTDADFDFLVSDDIVYHKLSDFRSGTALNSYKSLAHAQSELEKVRTRLTELRDSYHAATKEESKQMAPEMLELEKSEEEYIAIIRNLEQRIRKTELGQ